MILAGIILLITFITITFAAMGSGYYYVNKKTNENSIELNTMKSNIEKSEKDQNDSIETNFSSINKKLNDQDQAIIQEMRNFKNDIRQNVKTDSVTVGDKWKFMGATGSNDDWLRVTDKDGKQYYGGLAVGKVFTNDGAYLNGKTEIRGDMTLYNNEIIKGNNTLEFGQDIEKEANAGKIRYQGFSDGLDIVGAGKNNQTRKVHVWDTLDVQKDINLGGDQTLSRNNTLEFGKDIEKETNAGKIRYQGWSDGLDIVGAGKNGQPRKVHLWDQLDIQGDVNLGGNQIVFGNNTIELGRGKEKEVNAGKIRYQGWSDGLDIVGAGKAGQQRKVHIWDTLDVQGDVTLVGKNTLETGKGMDKEVNAGKIRYQGWSDGLDIVGAGKDGINRKVHIWDTLDVQGDLNTARNARVYGNTRLDNEISVGGGGKVEIDAPGVPGGRLSMDPQGNMVIGGNQSLMKNNTLEFGKGIEKEINAGKIRYQGWSDGLDIVGAGKNGHRRKVKVWDTLDVQGDVTLVGNNTLETGKGMDKQVDAGKIRYQGWSDGLDIVGAGKNGQQRKVRVWDTLDVQGDANLKRGINVTDNDPGPLIQKQYGNNNGVRYGVGQFGNGKMRMYAASEYGPATTNLSIAKPDGSFDDVLTVDNSKKVTVNGDVTLVGNNTLETGKGMDKEVNAGKIRYQAWSDGLDIVGAGKNGQPRKVHVWDQLDVQGDANIYGKVSVNNTFCIQDVCIDKNKLQQIINKTQ